MREYTDAKPLSAETTFQKMEIETELAKRFPGLEVPRVGLKFDSVALKPLGNI